MLVHEASLPSCIMEELFAYKTLKHVDGTWYIP